MRDLRFTIYDLRALCVLGLLLLSGCGGTRLFQARQQVVAHEVVSATGQTNVVWTTNIVYTVNPAATGALNTAREMAREVGGPWGSVAAGIFGLATVVLGRIAQVKSRQAAVVPAVISGVENAGNADVKHFIQQAAKAAGVEDRLNDMVRKITR